MARSADRYQERIKRAGIRQRDLADRLGVHETTVSRWFNSNSMPDPIGVKLDQLLGEIESELQPEYLINSDEYQKEITSERRPVSLASQLNECVSDLEKRRKGTANKSETCWSTLDESWGNWIAPGRLIIVSGKTGEGKTSFAQQLSESLSIQKASLYFSLEMPAKDLSWRTISRFSGVQLQVLEDPSKLTKSNVLAIEEAYRSAANLNLNIVDWADDISEIVSIIERTYESLKGSKAPLESVFIDYIQLMKAPGDNRAYQIGNITRELKKVAIKLGVTVVAVSQYNREYKRNDGQLPEITDLKDSSQIAHDADLIIDINVPKHDPKDGYDSVNVRVLKSRDYKRQNKKLAVVRETMNFEDIVSA